MHVHLKKVIRISKQHQISSLADFISLRYGKNRFLGALVTVICVVGILPYLFISRKKEKSELVRLVRPIQN